MAACVLAAMCLLSNIGVWFVPDYRRFYPPMDIAAAVFFLAQWWRWRRWWQIALTALLFAEIGFHFFMASASEYPLALNLLFLAQLGSVNAESVRILIDRSEGAQR